MIAVYSVVLSWCSCGLRSSPEFRILHQILLSFFYYAWRFDYLDIGREAYLLQVVKDLSSDDSSIAGLNLYADGYLRSGGILSGQTVAGIVYPYIDKRGDVDIPPTLYVVRRQCWRAGRQFVSISSQLEEHLLGFVSWLPFGGVVSAMSLWRLS